MALANAAGATTAIVFIACRILVGMLPTFMFSMAQSWFHGIELAQANTWNIPVSTFIFGLV